MTKNDGDVTMRELASIERKEALRLLDEAPVTGATIRYARKALGLRQSELAEKVGCSVDVVKDLERGFRPIAADELTAIVGLVKSAAAYWGET